MNTPEQIIAFEQDRGIPRSAIYWCGALVRAAVCDDKCDGARIGSNPPCAQNLQACSRHVCFRGWKV